jgi:glycerol-3-phosphate cytidylyltransferase-like family protein
MTYKKAPIISYADRLEMVKSCRYVDDVYENADLITTNDLLFKLNADYVFAGRENLEYINKYYQVSNDKLILLDRTSHICTSDIINKIIKNRQI